MKKIYNVPKAELVSLDIKDVITVSFLFLKERGGLDDGADWEA